MYFLLRYQNGIKGLRKVKYSLTDSVLDYSYIDSIDYGLRCKAY